MDFPIKLHTVKSGWSIVYIEGSQVIISKNIAFLSLTIDFVLADSADPDEMPHYVHCFSKVPILGFLVFKRLTKYCYSVGREIYIFNFCRLLVTFANSLYRDQDRHNVGHDLDPNSLTL